MVNQKRIALFVDIDNMPLNKKHVDNIITQLEKDGEVVYAKIYGVTDRRHREIICDAVARGFETVPPVYPTRRGSTKVFDIRILVDLCELIATNKSIDGVAIVANPAHQVYLFSRLKRNGIKIFACDNLDGDSAKFVDEVLSFGYNDPNSTAKAKKAPKQDTSVDVVEEQPVEKQVAEQPACDVEQEVASAVTEPVVEEQPVVDEVVADEVAEEQSVEQFEEQQPVEEELVEEQPVEEQIVEEQPQQQEQAPVEEQIEEPQPQVVDEPADEQAPVEEEQPEEEIVVEQVESEEEQQNDDLDILRQIQQIKQDVPSSDDEEDEALIEKIKQLLDEFN